MTHPDFIQLDGPYRRTITQRIRRTARELLRFLCSPRAW